MFKNFKANQFLWLFTLLNLVNYIDRAIISAVLEAVKAEFTLTDEKAGFLATAFMLGYFITSPIFGYLGDKITRKYLVASGVFLWSLGTVLTGFAQSYEVLLVYRVLVGVGEASFAALIPSMIADLYPPHKRNNALSWFSMALPVGFALGYLLGGWIVQHWGWHWAFIWCGLPGLFLAFLLLPLREPKRGESDPDFVEGHEEQIGGIADVFKIFKSARYNLVVWGYVAYTFAMGAYSHWGPTFLQREHGVPASQASLFFGAVLIIGGFFGTFVGGRLGTYLQEKTHGGYGWLLGCSVMIAAPITYASFVVTDLNTVYLLLFFAMFLLFMSAGPVNTVILEAVPTRFRSSAMALSVFLIHAFGDMWSPTLVGHVSDHYGGLRQGLSLLPVSLAVGAILWLGLAFKSQEKKANAV